MRTGKNKVLLRMILVILMYVSIVGCQKDENEPYQVVADIDGNVYQTVKIGNQLWMAENLRTTRYRNGDSIFHVKEADTWNLKPQGAWCNFDNFDRNDKIYGKLYNGYAVQDSRNIAPIGWHIPSADEWWELNLYVSAHTGKSGSLAKALASITSWQVTPVVNTPGDDFKNNNSSGFNGLPGGFRESSGTFFNESIGQDGYWWSTSEMIWNLNYNNPDINILNENIRNRGYSVRCIKDQDNQD